MTTLNTYRLGFPEAADAAFAVDTSGSNNIQEGDLAMYDASNFRAVPLTSGNGPKFIGVAMAPAPNPTSQVDNKSGLVTSVPIRSHGVFTFNKTTGDSLVHGDALVIGADAQTVLKKTSENATEIIGYVWNPLQLAALTGAGTVDVLITPNFPAAMAAI